MSARSALVVIAAVISVFFASPARADKLRSRVVASPVSSPLAVVPGGEGTAFIFGTDQSSNDLVAVEWDIASARELGRVALERDAQPSCATAQRAGNTVYLATGCSALVLFTLDVSSHSPTVVDRLALGESLFTTSLVVDERWVLVGAYEAREPVVPRSAVDGFAPSEVLHVRAIERTTGQIKGARVFRGDQLLTTNARPPSALALVNGAAMIALPMGNKVRVVRAELPSLVPSTTIDLAVFGAWDAVGMLAAIDGRLLAMTEKEWVLFDPQLNVVRRHAAAGALPSHLAVEPGTNRLLADAELPAMSTTRTSIDTVALTWAWGRAIAIGHDSNSDPVIELLAR